MFVPDRPFQPSLIFVSKAKAYPGEAHFRCSTVMLDPGPYSQHFIFFVTYERTLEPNVLQNTTLESLARENHSI